MASPKLPTDAAAKRPLDPFRRAVLRGLGVLLPPLLTIVIFLWVGNSVASYLLAPMEETARYVLTEYVADIRAVGATPTDQIKRIDKNTAEIDGKEYRLTKDDKYLPVEVYTEVVKKAGRDAVPTTAREIYVRYINERYLRREYVVPLFLGVFILVLYLLGKFLAAGIGRFFWTQFERVIDRVPLVRNVYSSVKQVTDFLFTDPDLEYTRVVAVEYPRQGIWTVAFVTGESLLDIESAANEPVMSVLIPTSPMPFTGFTITVRKSETVDLNLTIDQAFQFIVSCGVVVPPQQLTKAANQNTSTVAQLGPTATLSNGVASNGAPATDAPIAAADNPDSPGEAT